MPSDGKKKATSIVYHSITEKGEKMHEAITHCGL